MAERKIKAKDVQPGMTLRMHGDQTVEAITRDYVAIRTNYSTWPLHEDAEVTIVVAD
jgi:hypothetical protein